MGRKILLIDDSAMLRRIAANVLHSQPGRYDVAAATRATEGFALACVGGIDLILLDDRVAGLVDVPLCRRFLADARTARIPMILLIGQGVRPPALDTLPPNVVDTLVKPFAPEQLSAVVNSVFNFTRTDHSLRELRLSLHPELRTDCDLQPGELPSEANRATSPVKARNGSSPGDKAPVSVFTSEDASGIKGDTASISLRNVVHAAADTGRTGVLRLWPAVGEPTDVIFDQGKIVVVSTCNGKSYSEGATEIMPGKVSAATVEEAVAEQNTSGIPFLLTLGTHGLLSKSSAVAFLHGFGQRQFARLWPQRSRPPVRFEFQPLEALPQYALRLDPSEKPLDEWLLESSRFLRADEVIANLRHEGLVGTPFLQTGWEAILTALKLSENERACLELIDARTDLPTLARKLGLTQEAVYLILFRFRCLDAVGYRTAPAAFVMTPRTNLRRVLPLNR